MQDCVKRTHNNKREVIALLCEVERVCMNRNWYIKGNTFGVFYVQLSRSVSSLYHFSATDFRKFSIFDLGNYQILVKKIPLGVASLAICVIISLIRWCSTLRRTKNLSYMNFSFKITSLRFSSIERQSTLQHNRTFYVLRMFVQSALYFSVSH